MPIFQQAAHRDAGGQHLHIAVDMLMGMLHGYYYIGGRGLISDPPATRDIHANAVAADQICVEANDLIVLHQSGAAFSKPRAGAGSEGQKPCLDPFAAALDVFRMQHRPDVILAHLP